MSDASLLPRDGGSVRPLFHTRGVSLRELLLLRFQSTSLEESFSRYSLPISLFQSRLAFCMASVFLVGDYVADCVFYGLGSNAANLLRVLLVAPAFFCFFLISYTSAIKQRYEMYVSIFYAIVSAALFYAIYLLDEAGGNGISQTVGFLNLFFILIFGFVLIGTRFYYSLASSSFVSMVYAALLYDRIGAGPQVYYLMYQIFTVFSLCVLLGYTREFVLRADFATQFELAEARLAKERSDAQYLDWLRRLAAFLRHEVRHPVAQINSNLELIQMSATEELQRKYVTSAFQGIQQVWNLIERASQATDAEAFVRQENPQRIALNQLLAELVGNFKQTYSGIEITFTSPETIWIRADPIVVKEAVGNLLSNAISFARADSAVGLSLESNKNEAIVRVRNKGPLLQVEAKDLFRPFVSSRSTPSSEHHGLGLYLVRLIAEHYGGTATLANCRDESGVEASISLPLVT